MQLIHIDAIEAKPGEAAFKRPGQVFGTGVVGPLSGAGPFPSALGGDYQADGIRVQRFGDEFFRCARAV